MNTRPWDGLDRKFHPHQRIFMSIDAIGSTRLKSSMAESHCTPDVWAKSFMAFIPEVQALYVRKFAEAINEYCRTEECDCRCAPAPEDLETGNTPASNFQKILVWKYIGDEVILVSELTCKKFQAALHVLALAMTIRSFNESFKNNPIIIGNAEHTLLCKGTAWVAGFPVKNIEVLLPGTNGNMVDYLGPSIDLGFRLSKFATEQRLVISTSLASLIINGSYLKKPIAGFSDTTPKLHLCFGGAVKIKGIKKGCHPLIWHPVMETEENKLCMVKNDDLKNYFHHDDYFTGSSILPFIVDDKFVNQHYFCKYEEAVARQKNIPNSIFYNRL